MKIAVDAMGGDNAPTVVVQGAIQASHESNVNIILVGDSEAISVELSDNQKRKYVSVHHCREKVLMEESPLRAVRNKKDSSIRVAFDLLKQGEVEAVVSAGNSGATMASGIISLGKIEGVERPALACVIPGDKGNVIIIDVGGNVDCRPVHLLQFGIMADAFATSCMGLNKPKIGLLSIGREAGKGNEQVRLAHDLLQDSPLNFVGNIEGRDILSGRVQIIVCDGFIGNVVLKLSESLAESATSRLKEGLMTSLAGKTLSLIGRGFLKRFEKSLDYAEYGGAPILGINGVGIVCHGRSSARAIKNAIKMAVNYADNHVQEKLSAQIAELRV